MGSKHTHYRASTYRRRKNSFRRSFLRFFRRRSRTFRRWAVLSSGVAVLIFATVTGLALHAGEQQTVVPGIAKEPRHTGLLSLSTVRELVQAVLPGGGGAAGNGSGSANGSSSSGGGSTAGTGGSTLSNVLEHVHITTTVFWVGEPATAENGYIQNSSSTWDENWKQHFGGFDDPDHRSGYYPTGFTPTENPFYAALPYSDLDDNGSRRASASSCPEAAAKKGQKTSWCKNTWLSITNEKNGKTCYAQWEDAGPYGENDTAYVFGTAQPANQIDTKAGLDVSPATRDCLGMTDNTKATWHFTAPSAVPSGPWKQIITTTPSYEAN